MSGHTSCLLVYAYMLVLILWQAWRVATAEIAWDEARAALRTDTPEQDTIG